MDRQGMASGGWPPWGRPPYFCSRGGTDNSTEELMGNLLPGGYTFIHLVFWTVVGMVAVGTNAVAIILVIGLSMMALEAVQRR